jgi:hypothetical protein
MDDTTISAELHRAAASDSRELDRICEQVAAALIDDGIEPPFQVSSADFDTDPFLICADRYWYRRFLALPSVRTAAECASWLNDQVAGEHRAVIEQKWTLGYAFVTKDTVESRTELAEATEDIVSRDQSSGHIAFFAALYHAGKLRSNFNFDELRQFLESSLLALAAGARREEPIFIALQAFAAFGSRAITAEHAISLLERAWTSADRTRHVVDVCVNGLSSAAPFDTQGELLRQHAQEAITAYPNDHIFHFRLATGQHMCGDHDGALDNIDIALRLLPAIGNRGSHKLLQEQYLAKRDAIQEGRLRAVWAAQQQQRWDRQEAANADIQQTVQSSAIRAVELVAIFTAAIAFAVGSLQVTLNGSLTLSDRIWLVATLGAGLAIFALLIIGGTWFITRTRRRG